MSNELDYQSLHERVEKKVQKQRRIVMGIMFGISILIFILFSVIAWGILRADPQLVSLLEVEGSELAGVLVMFITGWITTLITNGMGAAAAAGWMDKKIRGQVAMEELGEELLQQYQAEMNEKPKRGERLADEAEAVVELSDDGELIPVERRQHS